VDEFRLGNANEGKGSSEKRKKGLYKGRSREFVGKVEKPHRGIPRSRKGVEQKNMWDQNQGTKVDLLREIRGS